MPQPWAPPSLAVPTVFSDTRAGPRDKGQACAEKDARSRMGVGTHMKKEQQWEKPPGLSSSQDLHGDPT